MNKEFEKLFNKLMQNAETFSRQINKEKPEEYVPTAIPQSTEHYKPAKIGPKPLTIKEYKQRQESYKKPTTTTQGEPKNKKTRAGKRVQRKKEITTLYRIIPIATGNTKRQLIHKLKELKKLQYGRTTIKTTADRHDSSKTGSQPF